MGHRDPDDGETREQTTALLRRARDGEREALDAVYSRCAGRLLALIRLRMGPELRSRMESRDLLQASLLKSFERIDQFEREGSLSLMAWLARIAENELRDRVEFHRRAKRDARADVAIDDERHPLAARMRSALSQVILDERARALEGALEALAPQHRDVIVLRKLEELSWAEVAARMDKTEDACRMLLARAMSALTREMHGGD